MYKFLQFLSINNPLFSMNGENGINYGINYVIITDITVYCTVSYGRENSKNFRNKIVTNRNYGVITITP